MELHQLAYVVAVAEESSFTRAAARVHVAQPGVSAQVRRLETELGQELFDRSGRVVRLTEAGHAVLPYARAALTAVESARQAVDSLTGLLRGRVTVGVVAGCFVLPGLADVLANFHREHPGVELSVTEGRSDDLVDGVRNGTFDLAIIGVSMKDPDGIELRTLVTEPLVAAVAPGHALAGRSSIGLGVLSRYPIISLARGTGVRGSFDAAARHARVDIRTALEASDPGVVMDLAARGLGVAVLVGSMAAARPEALHAIDIRPTITSRLALAWSAGRTHSPATRVLLEASRRELSVPA